ncbi:LiaF transmembrane domain-containing protein [Pedobacter sp.]|uniref:LiaF transmembrane domain-containing protein n=1 Tax=Pedobacter sp. TaxID=1411316 RepID=UPI00396C9676
MKFERVVWGVILLFIGGILLLDNLNIIHFYWRNVWHFWPIFLIVGGLNMLFNRNNSQVGSILSLVVVVITLSFLFFKGQENPRNRYFWGGNRNGDNDFNLDIDNERSEGEALTFFEPLAAADTAKKTILNLSGGGTFFELKGNSDSLFYAKVMRRSGRFFLNKNVTDTTNVLTFKMQDKGSRNKSWSFGSGRNNNVELNLSTVPVWYLNLSMGAGKLDFDLSDYKVRTLNFDGGAADVVLKVGRLMPISDINVKTGVANVEISVPETSGCRIKTETGLSNRDFEGFTKISDGVYETPGYRETKQKVFINLNGGLSNFNVSRY